MAIQGKSTDDRPVSEPAAGGEIELGVVVTARIPTTPGVESVGPLPAAIQYCAVFVGGISARSKAPDAALALIKFLIGPLGFEVGQRYPGTGRGISRRHYRANPFPARESVT